jgi:chemosensory pili system protein ChpA (sensor histidine kinase/response regulator)
MQALATDVSAEIDTGPLSWVKGEIDQALTRGLESLAKFAAAPSDVTALKHAQTHIHQAAGAIQMVGLDAVVAFTDEIERNLLRLEELDPEEARPTCEAIDHAGRRLKIFLDELVNGASLLTLRLFPEYEAMQQARGLQATPADLFFPDLSARASLPSVAADVPPASSRASRDAAPALSARPAVVAAR